MAKLKKKMTEYSERFSVSRETIERFDGYIELLRRWNFSVNLVSGKTLEFVWIRHVWDCVQLYEHLNPNLLLTDFGSGAGLPGMILSIMGVKEVRLIESDSRKAAFLMEASQYSSNKITVYNHRIDELTPWKSPYIVARGFAPLSVILDYGESFATRETKYVLLKGKNVDKEIVQARVFWEFDCESYPSITDMNSSFIVRRTSFNMEEKRGNIILVTNVRTNLSRSV
jgi:16S rRNA (guanine527-N7)-methyltransferase